MGLQEYWDSATPDLSKEWDAAAPQVQKQGPPPGFWDENPTARTIMRYGLPLATAAATAPFTGGMSLPLILATEGLASLGAETVNQAIGVNEFDPTQQALAFGAPGIGRPIGGIIQNIPRMIPGFGEALRAAIVPEMRELPSKLLPSKGAASLYAQLDRMVGSAPPQRLTQFPELRKAVTELETKADAIPWENLEQRLKVTGQGTLFNQIKETLQGVAPTMGKVSPTVGGKPLPAAGLPKQTGVVNPGRLKGLDFAEARSSVEALGQIISSTTNEAERGVYKKLYSAMLSDLEAMPAPAAGNLKVWQQARQLYKIEKARTMLQDATEKAISVKEGVDIIDPNKVVKWLKGNKEIQSRLDPATYRDILNTYRQMASSVGSNLPKYVSMLFGAFISKDTGGALAGYLGSTALTKAMMTKEGRVAVRLLASDPSRSNFRRFMSVAGVEARAALESMNDTDSIQLEN